MCCALSREQQTDPKDRTIAKLLMEAPALPQPAIAHFLADVAGGGDEWANLSLQVRSFVPLIVIV